MILQHRIIGCSLSISPMAGCLRPEMLENWHSDFSRLETFAWNKLILRDVLVKTDFQYPEGVFAEDILIAYDIRLEFFINKGYESVVHRSMILRQKIICLCFVLQIHGK